MSNIARAIDMIATERKRQTEVEGWTDQHDRQHRDGELAAAGMIYLHWDTEHRPPVHSDGTPLGWPWAARWFKPKDKISNLVRAGALFVAENDRLLSCASGYFGPDNWKPHLYQKYSLALNRLAALIDEPGQ